MPPLHPRCCPCSPQALPYRGRVVVVGDGGGRLVQSGVAVEHRVCAGTLRSTQRVSRQHPSSEFYSSKRLDGPKPQAQAPLSRIHARDE